MVKLDAWKSGHVQDRRRYRNSSSRLRRHAHHWQRHMGTPDDRPEALRTLKRVPELGIDFIDTADSYGPDVSEELIRGALYPYDGILIATKAGFRRPGPGVWETDGVQNICVSRRSGAAASLASSR